jgi:hypothetical protein
VNREKALRILSVLVGLLFVAGVYPLMTSVRSGWQENKEDALPMMLSLYVTLGIFLLVAAAQPVGESQLSPHGRVLLMPLAWRCRPPAI